MESKTTVYIVDDDNDVAQAMGFLIDTVGYNWRAFSNANDKKDVISLVDSTRRIFEQNKRQRE